MLTFVQLSLVVLYTEEIGMAYHIALYKVMGNLQL